jgi:hypothetical protein
MFNSAATVGSSYFAKMTFGNIVRKRSHQVCFTPTNRPYFKLIDSPEKCHVWTAPAVQGKRI